MRSDQARQRAEKSFRQEERARDARKAMTEYEAQAIAIRKKTARFEGASISHGSSGTGFQARLLTVAIHIRRWHAVSLQKWFLRRAPTDPRSARASPITFVPDSVGGNVRGKHG